MACNVKRTRCSTNRKCPPSSVFSAIASPGCSQFANPEVQQAEQLIYDAAFRDSINNFGVPVEYYINTFNLSAADTLYGEQPTSIFYGPMVVMMYVELPKVLEFLNSVVIASLLSDRRLKFTTFIALDALN